MTKTRKVTRTPEASEIEPRGLRIVLFFLFPVQVMFFGTGNVTSISCVDSLDPSTGIYSSYSFRSVHRSFYLDPAHRLIPIFSPFSLAGLLVSLNILHFVPALTWTNEVVLSVVQNCRTFALLFATWTRDYACHHFHCGYYNSW